MEKEQLPNEIVNDFKISNNNFILKKVLFYFFSLTIILFCFYMFLFVSPKDFGIDKKITIEQGMSLRSISKVLKENDIIRSRVVFETLIIMYGNEKHITPGEYGFKNKVSVFGVVEYFVDKVRNPISIKVTIPEGFNNEDIANLFSSKLKKFNKERFLMNAKSQQGYLFPDTYLFFSIADDEAVFKYMRENFDKKTKIINQDILSSGKSEKDIIIMASLIEREAKGDKDRDIISGILWNRIKKGMPLQVDAYMETYKKKGLPESPICNPGILSIKSAIHPINSNYLYYIHDKNGEIHFARSFEEHKKNISKYLK